MQFITALVQVYQPQVLTYETTNYVHCKGKDMTSLFKLIGGIESLTNHFPNLKVEKVLVGKVKELKRKIFKGKASIEGVKYQPGRGKG